MRPPRGKHRQRDRGEHEDDGRPRGGFGQHGGGGAGAECGLAAHAAESRGNVAALAALQQHNDDEEGANNDVNRGDQCNHVLSSLWGTSRDGQALEISRLVGADGPWQQPSDFPTSLAQGQRWEGTVRQRSMRWNQRRRMRLAARSITSITSAANSELRRFCSRRFALDEVNQVGSRYSSC